MQGLSVWLVQGLSPAAWIRGLGRGRLPRRAGWLSNVSGVEHAVGGDGLCKRRAAGEDEALHVRKVLPVEEGHVSEERRDTCQQGGRGGPRVSRRGGTVSAGVQMKD